MTSVYGEYSIPTHLSLESSHRELWIDIWVGIPGMVSTISKPGLNALSTYVVVPILVNRHFLIYIYFISTNSVSRCDPLVLGGVEMLVTMAECPPVRMEGEAAATSGFASHIG